MVQLDAMLDIPPYSLDATARQALHSAALRELTLHHYERCAPYRRILDTLGSVPGSLDRIEDIPFLPVRLFKAFELKSVPDDEVFKILTSSGTTGQRVSRIVLDRRTAVTQTKVLAKIVASFIGGKRLPMLVLDTPSVLKDRAMFSARGAGILGFSIFGTDITYALDDSMALDYETVTAFCRRHAGEPVLLFGFTFMVWQYVVQELRRSQQRLPLEQAVLFHGGGWKKLQEQAQDPASFKQALQEVCGLTRVHNYYGMVEQTGSIYMECEHGNLHSSVFSDVLIRDQDFRCCEPGREGLVQTVSLLPLSYPGHSLLTEDVGTILGVDSCGCGRFGTSFRIHGRLERAELRGCSDTFTANS